ncbi:uncharacterized protein EV154DRAFT_535637 [Mucor mucedo]|uniref:uncharacterized protein n=1 Tax=Mucor mucedo TaxID=29922 RepID=UPI002220D1F6|nr:uncharacterized protein EV154DRAFT_535637 [Mucor mucedo]KAI7896695.1 hypothetical protein EV154DRAFT_535637 [Mucor mucedo]
MEHGDLIASFIQTTGAPESQAQFYLELSQWNLELAVSQYFDNEAAAEPMSEEVPREPAPTPTTASSSSASANARTPTFNKKPAAKGNVKLASRSKIRTLNDIGAANDSDEEHENLYAGGEKSGGPAPEEEPAARVKKPTYYTGSGYRLGSEDEPSTLAQPSSPVAPALVQETEPVTRHLTFWRNGFSVDDGPLYLYTDPANQEMLTAINSGRAPLSLLNVRHGQPVEVRVVKRQEEDYTAPPKAPPKPFEGTGNRLGSPATYVPPTTTAAAPGAFPSSSTSAVPPTVDESQPTTNIQIRLGNGTRLTAKLNHTHTVGDIRHFIDS